MTAVVAISAVQTFFRLQGTRTGAGTGAGVGTRTGGGTTRIGTDTGRDIQ